MSFTVLVRRRARAPRAWVAALWLLVPPLSACLGPGTLNEDRCAYRSGRALIAAECTVCHAADLRGPSRAGAPDGVDFDTEADQLAQAAAIVREAVTFESMPPSRVLSACEQDVLLSYLEALERASQ